jgi:hypothetical protein
MDMTERLKVLEEYDEKNCHKFYMYYVLNELYLIYNGLLRSKNVVNALENLKDLMEELDS